MADQHEKKSGTSFFKGRKPVSDKRVLAMAKQIKAAQKRDKK
jgi:hypothetical protein